MAIPDLTFKKPEFSSMPPAARIGLCRHVPLDNSYKNTLTFKNEAEQLAYFEGKLAYDYTSVTPYRFDKPIRVNRPQEALYDCNYIILKNSNFTAKNLFAFITKIEYVNINVSNVYFEIDIFQTFYFNMKIQRCFVERHHVNSDRIGEHILDEGLPIGEYKTIRLGNQPQLGAKVIAVQSRYGTSVGKMQSGVYSGLTTSYWGTGASGLRQLETFLTQNYIDKGKEDAVVNIFMCHEKFINGEKNKIPTQTNQTSSKYMDFSIGKRYTDFDGYTPHNNKLYCYPYNFLYVDTGNGQSAAYRYEWFTNEKNATFRIYGVTNSHYELGLVPTNYNGSIHCYAEMISLTGAPLGSWSGDTYKAWLAQNQGSIAMAAVNAGVNTVVGAVTKNPKEVYQGLMSFADMENQQYKASIAPDRVHGTATANLAFSSGFFNFNMYQKQIHHNDARFIDSYLDVYGYKVNCLSKPHITGRRSWNFVKTNGSCVTGDIPNNYLAKINEVFDRGITFWHGDYVGDYSRDNSII